MLPKADQAHIDDRKITEYLLSPDHQNGKHKAAFLRLFGFELSAWHLLRDALLKHALDNEAIFGETTPYGPTYEVSGPLSSPDGRNPFVLVIWMFRTGEEFPRLAAVVPSRPNEP